jgi:hypothetical protein
MGAIQEVLFFGVVGGQLTHLEQEPFGPALAARGIEVAERGGGFCRDSLAWETSGWRRGSPEEGKLLRVTYSVSGRSLAVAGVHLLEGPSSHNPPEGTLHDVRTLRRRVTPDGAQRGPGCRSVG